MDEDKQQWISIAAVVLIIAGLGYFLFRQGQQPEEDSSALEEQVAEERAEEVLSEMNIELPENVERATLRDVAGVGAAGVATRDEVVEGEDENREYSLLVSLPDLAENEFYEGYLVGEGDPVFLGKLRQAKGGWMLDYTLEKEIEGEPVVKVTRETVDDQQPEETVLEGNFNN